mgnify:CR=1 FL=1
MKGVVVLSFPRSAPLWRGNAAPDAPASSNIGMKNILRSRAPSPLGGEGWDEGGFVVKSAIDGRGNDGALAALSLSYRAKRA